MRRLVRARLQLALLALALLTGFCLRWSAADHGCITAWDEAFHALAAKNLTEHPLTPTLYEEPYFNRGLKDWPRSHIWLHKPPVPLWMMAACIRLAGEDAPVFRFPSVLMGTLMALLAFLILRELFGEEAQWAGVLAAWLTALNPLMIRLASGMIPSDHTDLAMSFFVMLSVWLFAAAHRRDSPRLSALAGAAMGLGFLSKVWPALTALIPAAALLLAGRRRKGLWSLGWALAAFALTILPWHVYTAVRWPSEYVHELHYNTLGHLAAPLTGEGIPLWYYFELIPSQFGGAAAAAFILVLGSTLWCARECRKRNDPRLLALLLWALVPYAVFSLSRTKLYSYTAPAVPAFLLLAAAPMLFLKDLGRRWKKTALLCAAALWSVHLLSLGSERLRADFSRCPGNGVYEETEFRRNMRWLKAVPGRKVLFNVLEDKHIEAMYHCGCSAYPGMPSPAALRRLEDEGARAYVLLDRTEAGWKEHARVLAEAGVLAHVGVLKLPGEPEPLESSPYEL